MLRVCAGLCQFCSDFVKKHACFSARRSSPASMAPRSPSRPACRRYEPARSGARGASASSSSRVACGETWMRSRTLPLTCTTISTMSRSSSDRSASGQRRLPHALAGQRLVDLRAGVRGEREDQRSRGRGREVQRRRLDGVAAAVGLVDQLHDRGDRGVEREAAGHVVGDLVDRPVRLAHQLEVVALGRLRAGPAAAAARRAGQLRRPGATDGPGSGARPRRPRRSSPRPGRAAPMNRM